VDPVAVCHHPPMRTGSDPLAGIGLLVVDGSNLLHALRASPNSDGGPVPPPAALIGRLRGVVPASIEIQLVFDGPPERGLGSARIASGLSVRYAGRRSADEAILETIRNRPAGATLGETALVVTDDRELVRNVWRLGARAVGTEWLLRRLGRARLSSPGPGRSRAPVSPDTTDAPSGEPGSESGRRPWRPGRGATTKKGNPRRGNPPWRRR